MMMVSFASNEADPLKRLFKIARSSAQAKHFTADVANSYDSDASLPGLPVMMTAAAGVVDGLRLADLDVRLPCNVVVSNVPGPREQLYSNGAQMLSHYPVSIPAHGEGVNITVQSYMDQLFFGITACAKALPDAPVLRKDILEAFGELRRAVRPAGAAQHDVTAISRIGVKDEPRKAPAYRDESSPRAA